LTIWAAALSGSPDALEERAVAAALAAPADGFLASAEAALDAPRALDVRVQVGPRALDARAQVELQEQDGARASGAPPEQDGELAPLDAELDELPNSFAQQALLVSAQGLQDASLAVGVALLQLAREAPDALAALPADAVPAEAAVRFLAPRPVVEPPIARGLALAPDVAAPVDSLE